MYGYAKSQNFDVSETKDLVSFADYGLKWHFEGYKPYADNIYVKFDPTVSFTANILEDGYKAIKDKEGNQDLYYEYLPIGTCPIIGIDGAGAVVEIDLVVGAEGKIEFQAVYTGTIVKTITTASDGSYTADTMRVVLSWKAKDVDLDARMYGVANGKTAFDVYWRNKNSNDRYSASLDVDNKGTYSTGSQTITVGKMNGLDHILFYVNDYNNL